MRSVTLLAIVAIIALGTAATASAILIPTTVHAATCKDNDFGFDCKGCVFGGSGYENSEGKCHHHQ